MNKTILEVILDHLDLCMGEKFNILQHNGVRYISMGNFIFQSDGLYQLDKYDKPFNKPADAIFTNLCAGMYHIKKIPFVPKVGDTYYTVEVEIDDYDCTDAKVVSYTWDCVTFDLALYQLGLVFRTPQEVEANKQKAVKALTEKWFTDNEFVKEHD